MTLRDDIVKFCNDTLSLKDFPDYGPMGLQFAGDGQVKGIACAVSVSKKVIQRAHDAGANILIVHHGMFWNNESRILDERVGGRLKLLEDYGMSLLAYHLALDAHPKYGNNILLARNLGLQKVHRWADIGYSGEYKTPMHVGDFRLRAFNRLQMEDAQTSVSRFTRMPLSWLACEDGYIRKAAVIAGGAAHYIVQAHRDGFDTFVTGEASEPALYLAQDLGMNFFAFGHDKTERAGVQSLSRLVAKRFNLPWDFLPVNNPV